MVGDASFTPNLRSTWSGAPICRFTPGCPYQNVAYSNQTITTVKPDVRLPQARIRRCRMALNERNRLAAVHNRQVCSADISVPTSPPVPTVRPLHRVGGEFHRHIVLRMSTITGRTCPPLLNSTHLGSFTAPFTVLRLLTPLKFSYAAAKKRAEPYTKIVGELPEMRRETVELVRRAVSGEPERLRVGE